MSESSDRPVRYFGENARGWLWLNWPRLVLWAALSIYFWFMVVPKEVRVETWLPTITPGQRTALLLGLVVAAVAAGWRLCFSGRGYLGGKYVRYLVQSVFLTPVLLAAVIFLLFAYVPQMREIYLAIIEERRYGQGLMGLAMILLLSALLGCWQRDVGARMLNSLYTDHADLTFNRGLGRVIAFKGNLSSVLPLMGLFAGLAGLVVDASTQVERLVQVDTLLGFKTAADLAKLNDALDRLMWALPFAAFAAGLALWLVMLGLRYISTRARGISRGVVGLSVLLMLAMIVLPPLQAETTVSLARAVGPLAVVTAALIAIVTFLALLSRLSVRMRLPMTGIFLATVVLTLVVPAMFGAAPEESRRNRAGYPPPEKADVLHDAFRLWLEARPDKDKYIKAGKPYPVFIVAASGGGIYAASAAATFLANLQDDCANFSHHVFMISGVSGGAVGASIFNALANALPDDANGCSKVIGNTVLADHTERIIRSDHLSPVVAVLISDILHKVLLGSGSGDGDRADLLQSGFARAFADSAACSRDLVDGACRTLRITRGLGVPFNEHWSANGRGPALLLNTTWSETGYRVGFAPFPLHASSEGTLYNFEEIADRAALRRSLIEAAVVSARFPGIVPAWHIDPLNQGGSRQRWNFVDGGYVDNSGSTSAVEIYEQIRELNKGKLPYAIDHRLILLTDSEPELILAEIQGSSYSDTVAPLKALFQVRAQLAARAIAESIKRLAPGVQRRGLTARGGDSHVWLVNLEQGAFPLPLGWKISRITNNVVGYMMGRPEWCRDAVPIVPVTEERREEAKKVQRALEAVVENSCVKNRILELIRQVPDPS